MTHAISDFPDASRDAIDRAAGALRRAKAVPAAANLCSNWASKRLNEAKRCSVLPVLVVVISRSIRELQDLSVASGLP